MKWWARLIARWLGAWSILSSRCQSVRFGGWVAGSRVLRPGGPGLGRVCGAGFLFRWLLPGAAGSCAASGGVLGLRPTGGEVHQVTCGVDVPVQVQAAVLAVVGALGQGQLGGRAPRAPRGPPPR